MTASKRYQSGPQTGVGQESSNDVAVQWWAVLAFVDLLLFPRLQFAFSIPSALLIVVFTIVGHQLDLHKVLVWLGILFCLVASLLYGVRSGHNADPVESLKRALQLMSILLFAFYRVELP